LYLSLSHTVPRVGVATAITLLVVGQLLAGMVIDHFGAFGLDAQPLRADRIAAVVLLLGGAYLMLR
jgi:transporter family-2 protein